MQARPDRSPVQRQRATSITGPSHLFFLLEGYAILDNATMPVVGSPETVNNTYVEQIVMSAKAAIDKATEMGVTDPDRVGVGGHSYGAFMTANLLAHSDLFRAGIARSGAYNRTLTPFGFQSERRTLWEAPELYLKVSPFMVASKDQRTDADDSRRSRRQFGDVPDPVGADVPGDERPRRDGAAGDVAARGAWLRRTREYRARAL